MSHNPLAKEVRAKASQLKALQKRRFDLIASLDWYRSFDRAGAAEAVETQQGKLTAVEAELAKVTRDLAEGRKDRKRLHRKAKLGLNPAYWFSSERHDAWKREAKLYEVLVALEKREKTLARRHSRAQEALTTARQELARYDEFTVQSAESEAIALDAEIRLQQLEHDHVAERKQALDRLLKEPVKVLKQLQEEADRAEREQNVLRGQVDALQRDMDRAAAFDRELTHAANSYERAKIHEECEDELGDGSPRAVMADRRRKLSDFKGQITVKDRQVEQTRRNVAKAQRRLTEMVDRGSRDVRALVVDGSNMCYQGDDFIGLAALRPLCESLVATYDVTVVFDASIRRKLGGVSDSELRAALPEVTLHVVASRMKADETILSAAEDPLVYVLSRDRFAEYRDKSAVKEHRLITHEIINGCVLVRDLDLSVKFAANK